MGERTEIPPLPPALQLRPVPEGHVDLIGFTHDLAAWEGEKKERELLMRTRQRAQQKLRDGKRGKRDRTERKRNKEARSGEADSQRQPRQRTHMHAKGVAAAPVLTAPAPAPVGWCQQQRAEAEQKDKLFDWLRSLGLEHLQPRFVDEYQQLNVVLDGLEDEELDRLGITNPNERQLLQEEIAGEGSGAEVEGEAKGAGEQESAASFSRAERQEEQNRIKAEKQQDLRQTRTRWGKARNIVMYGWCVGREFVRLGSDTPGDRLKLSGAYEDNAEPVWEASQPFCFVGCKGRQNIYNTEFPNWTRYCAPCLDLITSVWKVSEAKYGHHSHSDMATNDPTDANYAALHQPAADCVCLRKRFTVAEVECAAATQMAQAAGIQLLRLPKAPESLNPAQPAAAACQLKAFQPRDVVRMPSDNGNTNESGSELDECLDFDACYD
jgi:hypothetical protein